MTVGDLKQKLKQYPDNMDVFVAERKTDFTYGLVNSIRKEEIGFSEDWDGKSLAKATVIIIDEE